MSEKFFYSKSGFAPYRDGSGFQVTVTLEQETETSEPTISIESVYQLSASEWISASRKIERLIDLIERKPETSS